MTTDYSFAFEDIGVTAGIGRAWRTRVALLRMLCRREQLSQLRLSQRAELKPSTVSRAIALFKEAGLVQDGPPIAADRLGPKEITLQINPDAGWAVGIQVFHKSYRLCLINANVQILYQQSQPLPGSIEDLIPLIVSKISSFSSDYRLDPQKLCGVGIGVPGIVSPTRGVIIRSQALQLENYPLRDKLAKHLKCPIHIDRSTVCGAYAEHYLGAARDTNNFGYLYIRYSQKIQSTSHAFAMVVNGQVYRGFNHAASEITGELFPILSINKLLQDQEALNEACHAYGKSLSRMVNLLDLQRLVIAADDEIPFDEQSYKLMYQTLVGGLVLANNRDFSMIHAELGKEGTVQGAALMALHQGLAESLRRFSKS